MINTLEEMVFVVRRHIPEQVFGIQTPPGKADSRLVHVGGEDFDAPFGKLRPEQIGDKHS